MGTLSSTFTTTLGGDADDTPTAYASQLQKLLPPGRLWGDVDSGTTLRKLLTALGDEFDRVRLRGVNLVEETDPRTAAETIDDWERMLSLPDEQVTEIPVLLSARQVAVTQKLVGRGGQNYSFFERLCEACGYPLISIERFAESMLRVGSRVGDRVYGEVFAYTMKLTLGPPVGSYLDVDAFERVIRHVTHAHIQVQFVYT